MNNPAIASSSSTAPLPGIHPARVNPGDLASWDSFCAARAAWPSLQLGQTWLEAPVPQFAPGTAWFAATTSDVVVGVEFTDKDVFNPATRFNQAGFLRGDVFELFWRPARQEPYYEIHVSPQGQILQLRFPAAQHKAPKKSELTGEERIAKVEEGLERFTVKEPLFALRLLHVSEGERWGCVVAVPRALMAGASKGVQGEDVTVSVSRYDYTRPEPRPVMSSTSPHPVPWFHRSQEWTPLFL
ncbi:hypothetical protein DB346_20810 [Verrucomicrobia bacterium LW23]|nr:hypothetical protein DB346_20810 [Verrucomicrobia bacterium LW23]